MHTVATALLRTDDVLQRGQEFTRQVAVRHQYDTDHSLSPRAAGLPGMPRRPGARE